MTKDDRPLFNIWGNKKLNVLLSLVRESYAARHDFSEQNRSLILYMVLGICRVQELVDFQGPVLEQIG